ncbi:MAG: PPC domain-containing protein, partial [Planctomycetaceae bacterium]
MAVRFARISWPEVGPADAAALVARCGPLAHRLPIGGGIRPKDWTTGGKAQIGRQRVVDATGVYRKVDYEKGDYMDKRTIAWGIVDRGLRVDRLWLAAWCLAALGSFGVDVRPVSAFDRIEPPAGTRGTEVQLTLTGSDLADPKELFFEEGRIEVVSLEAAGAGVKATVRIPADCPLGAPRMRVRTATGLSELRLFQVHRWPQDQEKEPNDLPGKAMPVDALGGTRTIWGTIRGEDVDGYRLNLPAGARLSAVVESVRLDQQMLDTHLELVDEAGFVVAACDDHPLLSQDPALTLTVPKAGEYVLRVRESAYSGNGVYLLHLGTFAVPKTAFPPGGVVGEEFEVEWLGDPDGPFRQRVRIPAAGIDRLAWVCPTRDGTDSAVRVPLRPTEKAPLLESEPNDEPTQPDELVDTVAACGRMDASDDVDWIRVKAEKGSKWRVTGWGRRIGSPIDLVVAAHRDDDKRQQITSSDDADGPDSLLTVTTPAEESFLLRVSDFQRRGGPEFVWWLDLEPVVEKVTVSVPPATTRTQQRLVAAVPRGNRTALVLNASREGCNDSVAIALDGLPAGVSAIASTLEAAAPAALVVFEAAAAAPAAVGLVDVAVTLGEGQDARRMGGLYQGTDTVLGEPN